MGCPKSVALAYRATRMKMMHGHSYYIEKLTLVEKGPKYHFQVEILSEPPETRYTCSAWSVGVGVSI